MPNGVRHIIGTLVGVVALPCVYFGLALGFGQLAGRLPEAVSAPVGPWPPVFVAVAALLVGVLAVWRRLSPLAALVTGLPLLALGLLWAFAPVIAEGLSLMIHFIGPRPVAAPGFTGVYILAGVVLLAGCFSPERWRGRPRRPPAHAAPSGSASSSLGTSGMPTQPIADPPTGPITQPWTSVTPGTAQPAPAPQQDKQPAGSLFQPTHTPPTTPPPLPKRRPSSST